MFDIPLTTRIEYVHPENVGLALTNEVACKEAIGKTFLIGGGPSGCQMRYRDYVSRLLTAFGLGPLDPKAFQGSETGRFYTDWLNTEESERLLQYQWISFETFAQQVSEQAKNTHILAEVFSPMIKSWQLGKSHYMPVPKWKKSMSTLKLKKIQKELPDKANKVAKPGVVEKTDKTI
jgi:UDP-glucose 4-epimerase